MHIIDLLRQMNRANPSMEYCNDEGRNIGVRRFTSAEIQLGQ